MSTPNDLPAYRVIYADGTSYVTSMAKNVTLGKARAYFVNASIEQPDGSCKRVADVQPYEPEQRGPAAVEQALKALIDAYIDTRGCSRLVAAGYAAKAAKDEHEAISRRVSR